MDRAQAADLSIRQLAEPLGAEIAGVDVGQAISEATFRRRSSTRCCRRRMYGEQLLGAGIPALAAVSAFERFRHWHDVG